MVKIEFEPSKHKLTIIDQREMKQFIIDARIAIAPHTDNLVNETIENQRDLHRIIIGGNPISGAIIKIVTQQEDAVWIFFVDQLGKPFGPLKATMDIASKENFHQATFAMFRVATTLTPVPQTLAITTSPIRTGAVKAT